MALENEQELVAAMEELRRQMQGLGTETATTASKIGQFGQNATKVGKQLGGVASDLAAGAGSFKSLGGVVDLTTKAVGGLLNIIPGVGGALKELAGAAGDAAKFVLAQFDDLSKNYQALGESSAITAKGLDGVQEQFRRMGLMTLPAFARAINQNTVGFAALGGTVAEGAEQFSKLAGAMTTGDIADNFIRLGMSLDQIGESSAKYVAAFTRYGLTQGKSFDELRNSTQAYLIEVDKIARITGVTAKQQEQEQQKNLANVQFRAKIEQMRANGQTEQAAELEKYVNGLSGPLADAARATLTGVPLTEEAAMANLVMGNALSESTRNIMNGSKATTELVRAQQAAAKGVQTFGGIMQYTGDIAGGAGAQIFDLAAIARRQKELEDKGLGSVEARAQAEQEALLRQQGSTKGFADASQKVAQTNKDMANLSFTLVNAAVPAVNMFSTAIQKVTGYIDKRFGGVPSAAPATVSSGGAGSAAVGSILETIRRRESGGNYQAQAKGSTASGAYQFIDSTWQNLTKKFGIGNEFSKAGMAPKEIQDAVAQAYVQDILKRAGGDVSKVPLEWYTGNIQGKMSSQAVAANNGLTAEMYQQKWMAEYGKTASTMGPVSGYESVITAPSMTKNLSSAPVSPENLQNTESSLMTVMSGMLDRLTSMENISRNQLNVQEKTYRASAS
jgi:hypothetical protein